MKKLINIMVVILIGIASNTFAQDTDYSKYAGFANFGNLSVLEEGEMVTEIIIEEKLLRMVAKFTKDDQELSELIDGLKLIKVNTFEVTPSNSKELLDKAKQIDNDLLDNNWDRIVKTKSKAEVTNIYVKTDGDEEFVGLTVVSIDKNGEAAFINIVGTINIDAISKLGDKFDIPGLDSVKSN